MMESEALSTITLAALGRPLHLGMLYDCRRDTMIPGVTLWDKKTIEKNVTPQPRTDFQIIASDRIEDKTSALNVSASLKASFLGGLVEVGGAAKYLKETKTSKKQARVTLQYSTTTRFEELTMTRLGQQNISYPEIFDKNTATHVVTAVQYGAQAFFVFSREVSSSEEMEDIQGELKAVIKKIPTVAIEGEGALTMSQDEKHKFENFSCTFHGDFALPKNPSTYEEAINIYKSLPSLLGADGKQAIPLQVWLYPLSKLDSKASQLVRSISSQQIEDVQAAMEELHELDMECNDMLTQPAAVHFPHIRSRVDKFKNLCRRYRMTFQEDLARVLPTVRGGGEEESALVDILTTKEKSPFSTTRLSEFLKSKQNEVNLISGYMNLLTESKAVEIVPSQLEMNQVLHDIRVELVISLMFTSTGEEDPFLSELNSWRTTKRLMEPTRPPSGDWFNDAEVIRRSRAFVSEFLEFTRCNASNKKIQFVVSSVPDPCNPGVSIYFYERGDLKDRAFQPPHPDPPRITPISHDKVQVTCAPLPAGTDPVLSYRVEYRTPSEESWSSVEGEDTSGVVTVTGLRPNCSYLFRQSVVSARWVTFPSGPAETNTLPCSPPEMVRGRQDGPQDITLTWREPGTIGAGTRVSAYKVEFTEEPTDTKTWKEQLTSGKVETCTIKGVNPKSPYRFRVSAICGTAGSSAPSEEYVLRREEDPFVWIPHRELRILVVGGPGAGKSAAGNTILGRREFATGDSSASTSRQCQVASCEYRGASVTVIDTPGLDRRLSQEERRNQFAQSVAFSAPGPHVILLVLPLRIPVNQIILSYLATYPLPGGSSPRVRLFEFQMRVLTTLRDLLGTGVEKHTMLLFTFKDHLEGASLEDFTNDPEWPLKGLLSRCGNRYCAFNNEATGEEEERQRQEFFDVIKRMMEANEGEFFRVNHG